jgi:hypothetical protein
MPTERGRRASLGKFQGRAVAVRDGHASRMREIGRWDYKHAVYVQCNYYTVLCMWASYSMKTSTSTQVQSVPSTAIRNTLHSGVNPLPCDGDMQAYKVGKTRTTTMNKLLRKSHVGALTRQQQWTLHNMPCQYGTVFVWR